MKGGIQNPADSMTQLAVCFGRGELQFLYPLYAWPDQLGYDTSRADRCVLLEDNHGSTAQTFPSVIEAAGLCISTIAGAVKFPQCSLASEGTVKAAA